MAIDDREVRAALTRLAHQAGNLRPALQAIGQVLVTRSDLSFRGSQDPWGGAWPELSETTILQRGKRAVKGQSLTTKKGNTRATALRKMLAAKPLRDSGRLAGSISAQVQGDGVVVGTNLIYAATHQFGRADNRFYNTPRGASAPIPPRPYLPIRGGGVDLPADDRADILDILQRHLKP